MLPTKRSAIALARGARTGDLTIRTSMAVNTVSNAAVNLGVAIADEEPEAALCVVEIHGEVAGLLGQPGAGGVGGDPEDVHAAGGVLDGEERVEPVQGDGVEVEQVTREDRVRLGLQEFGP